MKKIQVKKPPNHYNAGVVRKTAFEFIYPLNRERILELAADG